MGTDQLAEREVLQGLIKLAAAFVHAARGNPAGVAKNLRGARVRLAEAGSAADTRLGIDVAELINRIDARLAGEIRAGDPPIAIPRLGGARGD
jgi:hypothetical protein